MEVFAVNQIFVTVLTRGILVTSVKCVRYFILLDLQRWHIYVIFFLAQCIPDCQNEGVCSQPNTCDCTGTGYEGNRCEICMLLQSHVLFWIINVYCNDTCWIGSNISTKSIISLEKSAIKIWYTETREMSSVKIWRCPIHLHSNQHFCKWWFEIPPLLLLFIQLGTLFFSACWIFYFCSSLSCP